MPFLQYAICENTVLVSTSKIIYVLNGIGQGLVSWLTTGFYYYSSIQCVAHCYGSLVSYIYVKMYILAIYSQITNVQRKYLNAGHILAKVFDFAFFKFVLLQAQHVLGIRKLSLLVGISEAIRVLILLLISLEILKSSLQDPQLVCCMTLPLLASKMEMNNPNKSKEWLAGLIDADGYFSMSQKGYASLEITMDIRDKKALYFIKEKYGGSVKLRTGSKSKRYRLHHKKGLLNLIQDINGLIRNPIRLEQLNKVCVKYEWQALRASSIVSVYSSLLNYYNGWFSGFFDGDGSIYLSPDGIIISAANNVKPL